MANTRLFPPLLTASLPSATGGVIQIPFQHNPLVSYNDITGFQIVIKTVQGKELVNKYIDKPEVQTINVLTYSIEEGSNITAGNNYKVSIAYVDTNHVVGYFSTTAIIRYAGQLSATLQMNSACDYNGDRFIYGEFTHSDDPYEKAYTYRFVISDLSGTIILDTGDLIHNTSNDTGSFSSIDTLLFEYDFGDQEEDWNQYLVQYTCTTVSGLVLKSATRSLLYMCPTISPESYGGELPSLSVNTDIENAINHIYITTPAETKGRYLLKRGTVGSSRWNVIGRYILAGGKNNEEIALDYNIECGKQYIYSLQQYGAAGAISILFAKTSPVEANFNDCFLYDGERQLKIAYNPKISSFKATRLTNKTETIGSKYPYIFSNGIVDYKEFPISGLLSYQSDPDEKFMTLEELGLPRLAGVRITTNAHDNNNYYLSSNLEDLVINAERRFKLQVLNFLNSNKPKLFKSPIEGNYMVQTLNNSLSPNDTLGRMLHTFNCTAYEIANAENYPIQQLTLDFQPFAPDANVQLMSSSNGAVDLGDENNSYALIKATVVDATPGNRIKVVIKNFKTNTTYEQVYYIGATGQYYLEHDNNDSAIINFRVETENGNLSSTCNIVYWRKEYINLNNSFFDHRTPMHYELNVISEMISAQGEILVENVTAFKKFNIQNNNSQPAQVIINIGEESTEIVVAPHSTYTWEVQPEAMRSVRIINNSTQSINYDIVCLQQVGG